MGGGKFADYQLLNNCNLGDDSIYFLGVFAFFIIFALENATTKK